MSEWISAEDRLPPSDGFVVMYTPTDKLALFHIGLYDEIDAVWYDAEGNVKVDRTTHWMALHRPS